MGRRLDKILEDIAGDDENKETKAPEQPAETDTPPAEEPPKDEAEEPEEPEKEPPKEPEQPAGAPEEPPKDTPPAEPPKKDIPEDPMKRAEFSFKRQLGKQKEKYEKELKDRDDKYNAVLKELEEIKKGMNKEKPKTREDFDNDEDYINYLTDQRVQAALADHNAEAAKKEAEREEAARKKAEEDEELRERQEQWLGHVKDAFGGDKARSDRFLEKVAYANGHGFGQVLDACPVAADYLINDPMGPLVFERVLSDRATFERVFDPKRSSPMAVYYELRRVEDAVKAESAQPAGNPGQPAGQPNVVPAMGRPGKQAGGSSLASSDMFDDPKALRKWLREHRG